MQVLQQSNRLQRMKSVIWAHKAYTVSRNPFYGGNVVVVGALCRPQASKPFFKNLALFYPSVATLSYFASWNEHGTTWVFYLKEIMKSHLNYSAYLYKEKCTHQVNLIHKEKSILKQRDMSQRFEIAWQTALSKFAWWLIITSEFCLLDQMHQITAWKKDRANNCSICTPRNVERPIYDSGIIASARGFWNSLPFSWQMQKFPDQLNKRFQKISSDKELNGTVTSQPLSPPINLRF